MRTAQINCYQLCNWLRMFFQMGKAGCHVMWLFVRADRIASHRFDSVGWTLYLLTKPNCKSIGLNAFKVKAITTSGLNLYDSSEINEKFEAPLLSIGRIYSVSCFSH